uniref:Uncharacterized protein n=1 Tax=Fagus sylvatica TaxID=28930 RepID=A0A2N9I6Y6_FAGSY
MGCSTPLLSSWEEVAAKVVEEIVAEAATAETAEVAQDVTVEAFNNVARGTTNKNVVAEIAHGAEAIVSGVVLLKLLPRLNQLTSLLLQPNLLVGKPKELICNGASVHACEETPPPTWSHLWILVWMPATEEITAAGIIPAVEVPEDPNDNAPLEDMDMADVHDSYDAVLADVQEEQCPRLQFLNWRCASNRGRTAHSFFFIVFLTEIAHFIRTRRDEPVRRVVATLIRTRRDPPSCGTEYGSLIRTRRDEKPVRRVVAPTGSGNEFAAEDEGDFDAVEAAESASAAIQSPFASLERLGAEVDFYDYSVPRDGVQFLEAIWKKFLETYSAKGIGAGVTAEAAYGVVAGAVDMFPQDRDCDLGRCETADFYELLLALMGVHHSFIVASVNIVMIGKECMNVVGTIELIAGAIAEQTYKVWCCSRTSCSRFMILEGDDLAFVVL